MKREHRAFYTVLPSILSNITIEPDHLAENLDIRLVERLHGVILGLQADAGLFTEETLHRRRLTVDERHNDIAVVRCRLLTHKHEIAVEDADVLAIDSEAYLRLMERSSEVEAYTYRQAAERFSDVMWIMHQIVFMSFDERLAVFLLDETARSGSQALHMTHDEIARHMGSAREVVSRMLKYFQQEGLVDLSRGCITLLDRQRLHTIAS